MNDYNTAVKVPTNKALEHAKNCVYSLDAILVYCEMVIKRLQDDETPREIILNDAAMIAALDDYLSRLVSVA